MQKVPPPTPHPKTFIVFYGAAKCFRGWSEGSETES